MAKTSLLVVVKAYPVVDAGSRQEAVCVAGISVEEPRRWIRLFPLDFRGLPFSRRFSKYQIIDLELRPAMGDSRPESNTPNLDSIELGDSIGSDAGTWRRRLDFLEPVMDDSMCAIQRAQEETGQSLGAFVPEDISDLVVTAASAKFTAGQEGILDQGNIFDDKRSRLEPLAVKAKYWYRCADTRCRGHSQSLIDWELGQLYRRLRSDGESEEDSQRKVREKFLDELAGSNRETIFLTGNMAKHPKSFLILGLAYPKRPPQDALFP